MKKSGKALVLFGIITCLACGTVTACTSRDEDHENTKPHVEEAGISQAQQQEYLFAHLNLSMEDFRETNSRQDGGLSEWWYCGKEDTLNGIYVSIGNLQENDGDHYAQFADTGIALDGNEEYELEITTGTMGEDGFLDGESPMQSYYFMQTDDTINFVSRTESQN